MKIKSLVAASLLAVASVGSFAAGGQLGTLTTSGASFNTAVAPGSFSDNWQFSLSSLSNVGASLTNIQFSFGPSTFGAISSFAALLDGTVLNLLSVPVAVPGGTVTTNVLYGSKTLDAGLHTLNVSGFAGATGASYGGSIAVAPVPEPETYAMLLVGLGLMGAVVRRRNKSDSDQA